MSAITPQLPSPEYCYVQMDVEATCILCMLVTAIALCVTCGMVKQQPCEFMHTCWRPFSGCSAVLGSMVHRQQSCLQLLEDGLQVVLLPCMALSVVSSKAGTS